MNLKLRGYYDYYGITFNSRSIKTYFQQVKRLLFKWLNRRGGRKWNWLEYRKIVDEYCLLLRPRIYHSYRSESVFGGTVCGKAARTGLWGSGEVTNRSTRRFCSATFLIECSML